MQPIPDIRRLYFPIQPTIKQSADHVTYTEVLPHESLQPYIYCYWQLKTDEPLSAPFRYRVVADGCIDFFFELKQSADSYVMGFCKKFTEFPLPNQFHYVGVRFLPTMFPQLFGINAKELSNRFEHLNNVLPDTARFIAQQMHPQLDLDAIRQRFDAYFMQQLAAVRFNYDTRLYEALYIILRQCGAVQIEQQLNTGISARLLRRLFDYYIGDTAKTFSKVVRFQHILRAKPSTQSLRQNKLFFDAGYYDQAHFIKEFTHLYGVTPARAFGR